MTAFKSLFDAVDDSMNVTVDWEEECDCVLQHLLAASDAVNIVLPVIFAKVVLMT